MKRINLGNLRRIGIALPSIAEQDLIVERLQAAQQQIDVAVLEHQKLRSKKTGLMDDLLTGRVRVTPLLEANSSFVQRPAAQIVQEPAEQTGD